MKTIDDYVKHILWLKSMDADYARHALRQYDELLPWIELKKRVREALNEVREEGGRQSRAGGIDAAGGGGGG